MYRVDVVFDGALEECLHYSELEEAEQVWQKRISELMRFFPTEAFQVDLYDERPYPPEPVHTFTSVDY